MKIGILTFHRALNFGAVLQAYALTTALSSLGADCEVLDYRCEQVERAYWSKTFSRGQLTRATASNLLHWPFTQRTRNRFLAFTEQFTSDQRLLCLGDLVEAAGGYDAIISGSDQVWNPYLTGFDRAYFLDGIDSHKKYSYAASFGLEFIPEDLEDDIRCLLSDFQTISVREHSGQTLVRALLGEPVPLCLDPTMLLTREHWERVSKPSALRGRYVLVYCFRNPPSLLGFASELARQTKSDTLIISNSLRRNSHGRVVRGVGPREFLSLVRNAAYVVTNSFHGTTMSVLFGKPFYVELLPPPMQVNTRLMNILQLLGLEDRLIVGGANDSAVGDIAYTVVNEKILRERQKSVAYLRSIVESV